MNLARYQSSVHMSLDASILGWLDEKKGLSGSPNTEEAYDETLTDFRTLLKNADLDLNSEPGLIAPLAQGWAGKSKQEGKEGVAWATYNQRLAILSSYFEYAIRHDVLPYNPIERVKRRKKGAKNAAHFLPSDEVRKILLSIDTETLEGKRDYALLSIAFNTGRRASELSGLRYGHIQKQGEQAVIQWVHTKGGEQATNLLEKKATAALYSYLYAEYSAALGTLAGDAPVFLSHSDRNQGKAISTRTIERICEKRLGTGKAHTTRHTYAVTMSKRGASLQEIGRGLGHKNLKTTSDYMDEQLGYENPYASALEDAYGM